MTDGGDRTTMAVDVVGALDRIAFLCSDQLIFRINLIFPCQPRQQRQRATVRILTQRIRYTGNLSSAAALALSMARSTAVALGGRMLAG